MALAEGRSYVRRRKEEGGERRMNTGDSACFALPPNRPDGLGLALFSYQRWLHYTLGVTRAGGRIGDQGPGNTGRLRWTRGGLVWSGEWNFRIAPAVLVFRGPRLWAAVELARDGGIVLQRGPGPLRGSGVSPGRMSLLERRRVILEFSEGENRLHTFPAHRWSRSALR